MATLLGQLKSIVGQVGDSGCGTGSCCQPGCGASFPFLQVCMLEPPCTVVPTSPQYVKPLELPRQPRNIVVIDPEDDYQKRRSNFYNYHNIDYHKTGCEFSECNKPACRQRKVKTNCDDGHDICCKTVGCPTGFKPCKVRLCPPPGCHPLGTWKAEVQPCPPKPPKKKSVFYEPGPCTRPCCLHWKPKGGVCKYDQPCKAHCYDHPPGIKSSGRTTC